MNKIIITLLVVATVIGAIIVGIFIYMPGKGTEEKLENTTTVTSGEFAVVEETVKEYFKEYSNLRQQFMERVNDSKLQSVLTPENYEQDGPEFTESIKYINTAKEEFNNIADELLNLLSTENIETRIQDKDIGDYYKDLYKGYFINNNDLSSTFQETYQDTLDDRTLMNNLYDNEIEILSFLTENKEHWEVLDNKLTFDDQELANTFNNMIETNSSEERISPNAFITFKQTYKECGHTTSEFMEIPQEFVNLTKEELNEKYSDWTVEKFTDTDIILNRKVEGSCNEHYIVRNLNGIVTVFHILDDGTEEKYMVTDIATEYLTDTDKVEMEKGIEVNGKQNLNQLIEDFE